ncbi:MAG: conjugative transfer signal peptidase TraF [Bacteroidetes bacterium]|nr:conjugative transfer signal peptidase TraF [Bacteroidota bacterium]
MRCRILPTLQLVGVLAICGLSLIAFAVQSLPIGRMSLPLFVNTSASLPFGLYHLTKVASLERGDVLRTCLPDTLSQFAVQRGYLRQGTCPGGSTRIGKPVIALQGDTVLVSDQYIQVKGYRGFETPIYEHDRRGRRLSNAIGTHVLPPGKCFLLSTHSTLSYDSRYYGPVPCGSPPYYVLTSHGFKTP